LDADGAPVSAWIPELGSRTVRCVVLAQGDTNVTFTTSHFQR
jgi:hypothetical protein